MKSILFALILTTTTCFAGDGIELKSAMQYIEITSQKINKNLPDKTASIEFTFKEYSGTCLKDKVAFTQNKSNPIIPKIDINGITTHKLKPGKYKFKFWTSFCDTLVTEEIEVKNRYSLAIVVHLISNEIMIESDKPVIYLYPSKTTEVTLNLNYNGKLNFTYPQIHNNTWKVKANPDGTLESNGKQYNYLFWDGEMNSTQLKTNLKEGSVVDSKNLVTFFETSLASIGLNSKESADFITYWVPRMMKNEKNYIHFMFTSEYDNIASINVSPKPDEQLRIYMVWSNVEDNKTITPTPQSFPEFNREGFTLIEWGGSEIPNLLNDL